MFSNFLDLVPEDATVALKIDVQGYECKVRDFFTITLKLTKNCFFFKIKIKAYYVD